MSRHVKDVKEFLLKNGWTFTDDCYYIHSQLKSMYDKGEEWKDRKLTEREAFFYEVGFAHGRKGAPLPNLKRHILN